MNWYKQAQQVIDQREGTGEKTYYSDIGHDVYNNLYDYDYEDYVKTIDEPNYIWTLVNGVIDIEPETEKIPGHSYVSRWRGIPFRYYGRYSPKDKILSLVPPRKGVSQFRAIPMGIKDMLKQKFPEMQKLIIF